MLGQYHSRPHEHAEAGIDAGCAQQWIADRSDGGSELSTMSDKSTQDRCSYQVWWILPAIERRAGLSCGDWAESASYACAGYWHDPSRKRSWIMPVASTATSAIFIVLCQPIRAWFLPLAARMKSVVGALAFVRCGLYKACYNAVQAPHLNRQGHSTRASETLP